LLGYGYLDIKGLVRLIEKVGPIDVEEADKRIWESIPKRAEETWRSA